VLIANKIAVAPQLAHPTFDGVPQSESYETRYLLDEEKRSHLPRSADAPKHLVDANHFVANGSNFQWTRGIVRYDRAIAYCCKCYLFADIPKAAVWTSSIGWYQPVETRNVHIEVPINLACDRCRRFLSTVRIPPDIFSSEWGRKLLLWNFRCCPH
jgi:hypothetical protein